MPALSMVSLDDLSRLACPYCGRLVDADTEWAVAARDRWGWCGAEFVRDGVTVGALLLTPVVDAGSPAAMIMCAWVRPEAIRTGVGRQLVQGVSAGLVPRHVRTIVARGSRQHVSCAWPPRDFLRSVGFARGRDDRLWHLDLDQTVVERPTLREVLERLVGAIRPVAPPEPAGRAGPP